MKNYHHQCCYDKTSTGYTTKLYKFIRENNIKFNEIKFEILNKSIYDKKENANKWKVFLIKSFDSVKNGMNTRLPYTVADSLTL